MDLSRYVRMYEAFDAGHGPVHVATVRQAARALAKIYLPGELVLVDVAATLHDVGLSHGRDNHEIHGAAMVRQDAYLLEVLGATDLERVARAVEQHRASTGEPQSVLEKIISDADRGDVNTRAAIMRSVNFNSQRTPELSEQERLEMAMEHLQEKYGLRGTGLRCYFPETRLRLERVYGPIRRARNIDEFQRLL